jgi:hypothetical protein
VFDLSYGVFAGKLGSISHAGFRERGDLLFMTRQTLLLRIRRDRGEEKRKYKDKAKQWLSRKLIVDVESETRCVSLVSYLDPRYIENTSI